MPDDHSKLVPLLPIPNRTVKRLSADDSADSCVKVGHRQAIKPELAQLIFDQLGFFFSNQVVFKFGRCSIDFPLHHCDNHVLISY